MKQRIWIVSEFYYPEENATGYLLTKIAEGLARRFDVHVACGFPIQQHQRRVAKNEIRHGVHIHRCVSTALTKDILSFRLVNLLTVTTSICFTLLLKLRQNEKLLVVTNPPLLPFVAACAGMLRGASCSVLTYDVYPEALIAAGMAKPLGLTAKLVDWLNRMLFRSVENFVVLGRDMYSLVARKFPNNDHRVVLIPNWAELEEIKPLSRKKNPLLQQLGIEDKFVVQYLGNMGRTHGIEQLLECMEELSRETQIHFLFIGTGAKKQWLEEAIARSGLRNVSLLPYRSRTEHAIVQNACDLAVISMLPGMSGVSVPSRLYNIMAAGKPVVVIAENDSELARVVEEESIGWVVQPGKTKELVSNILKASKHPGDLKQRGMRARAAAEKKYSFQQSLSLYNELFRT